MVTIQNNMTPAQQQRMEKDQQDTRIEKALSRIKHKFIVMSGKGGVGKTSTTVNLAVGLANTGFRVGIIDVDLHGPDVPRMLGLTDTPGMTEDQRLKPLAFSDRLWAISVESLTPNKDDAIIWRGPIKYSAIRQFISDVAWDDLDFLLIDSPPGTGDEPLTVAQTIPDAKAIIVTTPQEVSLADVRKSISFCKTLNLPVFGIIENMSGMACPHCGEAIDLFGSGGGETLAEQSEIAFLGRIPLDPAMVAAGDRGTTVFGQAPDAPIAKAFAAVVAKLGTLA